jgi:ABC-type transporter MlaC component
LLLGITAMRRIAIFTLGRYATTATQADQDAFVSSFRHYALAVYQSYFAAYAGQTLQVMRSSEWRFLS